MDETVEELKTRFTEKVLGERNKMFGFRINRNREEKTINVNQTECIEKLLKEYYLMEAKPAKTTMEIGLKLEVRKE